MILRPIPRPLPWAGAGAVAGVLLVLHEAGWIAAAAAAGLLVWACARLDARALVLLAGAGAGALGAFDDRRDASRNLRILREAGLRRPDARQSPGIASCILRVENTGEDPFHHRAWLRGRTTRGVGILCAWPGEAPGELGPGAWVRVFGRFRVPRPPGNPGEADARVRLASSGASLVADLRTVENLRVLQPAPPSVRGALASVRREGARRLRASLPTRTAALGCALLLGVRSGLEDADRLRFERTGTLHLLAISGLHLLILAGGLHRLLKLLGLGPRLAAAGTLAFVLAYLPVTGGAPPIRRAATMATCYAIALLRGRPPDGASALGGAALLLALFDPLDVDRVGFRLSFTAVAGIFWLAPAWRDRWSRRTGLLRRFPLVRREQWLRLAVAGHVTTALPVALAAWLATAPWIANAFGIFNPWAPLANLAAAPFVTLMLPLIAAIACGFTVLAPVVVLLHRGLDTVLGLASSLPCALVALPMVPVLAMVCWFLGCALMRTRTAVGVAALGLSVLLLALGATHPSPGLVLFDVGHGQAALIRLSDGSNVLVDAGSHGRPRLARRVLLPALRELGVSRLDLIVCTHADADHWNAIPSLMARLPVGRLIVDQTPALALVAAARRYGVPIEEAREGSHLARTRGEALTVLATGPPPPASTNDRSLALGLRVGAWHVLLPADREEAGLRRLALRVPGPCDVLIAPHHGRPCAAAPEFGSAVRPSVLLASCGSRGTDRRSLDAYGATAVYRTDRDGCLTIRFPAGKGRGLAIGTFRGR
jgi:competence protein ComEC